MTQLTDEAKALADSQPNIIEVEEVPTPEVVTDTPSTGVDRVHTAEHRSALEAAADAAIMMPGVPGRDEFLSLAMQARMLSLSGAAPEAVRGDPHLAFHVAMVGRDLGISPSAALELIDVINGSKGPQLSLSPQLLNGQIRRLGLGSIRPRISTPLECVAVALGPDGQELGESTFTWEDARMAGLVGAECEPGDHKQQTRQRRNGGSYQTCGCNQGYITYPKRMLWWRASGFAADDFFPEAGLGLYSPEALGAVVDEDGRPLDPATVALPPGYEKNTPAPSTSNDLAPQDERDGIKARIDRLPPPAVEVLRETWQKADRDGNPTLLPLGKLPNRQVKVAHALIDSIEKRATKGEWGEWVAHQEGTSQPTAAQEAPDRPTDPEVPAGQPGATQDPEPDDLPECLIDGCTEPVTTVLDDGATYCTAHTPF